MFNVLMICLVELKDKFVLSYVSPDQIIFLSYHCYISDDTGKQLFKYTSKLLSVCKYIFLITTYLCMEWDALGALKNSNIWTVKQMEINSLQLQINEVIIIVMQSSAISTQSYCLFCFLGLKLERLSGK